MCLAIPGKIKEINDNKMALIDFGGVEKEASVELLQDVKIGDYVLIHAGFAIESIDKNEAEKTLELIKEMS